MCVIISILLPSLLSLSPFCSLAQTMSWCYTSEDLVTPPVLYIAPYGPYDPYSIISLDTSSLSIPSRTLSEDWFARPLVLFLVDFLGPVNLHRYIGPWPSALPFLGPLLLTSQPVYYAYSQAFWHQTVAVWDSNEICVETTVVVDTLGPAKVWPHG